MGRYVIGDIHGCVDELRQLVHAFPLNTSDQVVFLGDYIDRGPDSKEVVTFLVALQKQFPAVDFVFLKGNHEDMLLSYLGLGGRARRYVFDQRRQSHLSKLWFSGG